MGYSEKAEKLIETENDSERKKIIEGLSLSDPVKLARAIKDTYYTSWTTEPQKIKKAARSLKLLWKKYEEPEIRALADWVCGIADLTDGENEKAIKNLERAANTLLALGMEHPAGQTYPARLLALSLLGRYDEAIKCGNEAIKIFRKFGEDLEVGKIHNNLGNLMSRRELHAEAKKHYLSARKIFSKFKHDAFLLSAENGLAITFAALNDFRNAEKFYRISLARAKKLDSLIRQAEIEASIGNLALCRGRYDEALLFLENSRRKYAIAEMPHPMAAAEMEIADAYFELNLIKEAFEIYERVSDSFKDLKAQGEEAKARLNYGRAAIKLGKFEIANKELKEAEELFLLEKNTVGIGLVDLYQAELSLLQKDFGPALEFSKRSRKLFENAGVRRHIPAARLLQAGSLAGNEEFDPAAEILSKTFTEAMGNENPSIAQACIISLGNLSIKRNDPIAAEKYFKKAIELIENLRSPLPAEEFRMSYLADKLAPYEQLARIYLAKGLFAEALSMIEDSRSRSLTEDLGESGKSERNSKLEEAREELNWYYSRINRAKPEEIEVLLDEAKRLEKEITELLRNENSTARASLKASSKLDLKYLSGQLGRKRSLIEYYSFDSKICAFILSGEGIEYYPNLADESEIKSILESIHFQFGAMRYGSKNLGMFYSELKLKTDHHLKRLYQKLIAPFEHLIRGRGLVIIPHNELHYVPFQALHSGENYLIEQSAISYSPSALLLQRCLEKPKRADGRKALLLGFADEKIPFVDKEIISLGKIFPEKIALSGKEATFKAFQQNAESADILHLACHGQFRPDNALFSSLRLADGWVTVRDVCNLKLDCSLATLSACETGLNEIFAGNEILGLARGFLAAGVNSLLLTLWTVNDEAAIRLMNLFYGNLIKGASPSEALQKAQIEFIKEGSHPYFWSPFSITGLF